MLLSAAMSLDGSIDDLSPRRLVLSDAADLDRVGQARLRTTHWPMQADTYITTFALHDPQEWFKTRREAHLSLLAEARPMGDHVLLRYLVGDRDGRP